MWVTWHGTHGGHGVADSELRRAPSEVVFGFGFESLEGSEKHATHLDGGLY